jgi:hypothetical protein
MKALLIAVFFASFWFGCGRDDTQPSGTESAPKTTSTSTNTSTKPEEKKATTPPPAPVPTPAPEPIRLLNDGKYRLYSMGWGDEYGNNNYYTMGSGAYFLEVSFDKTDGRYLMKRSGLQNATGGGYPVVIGCSPGGIITKVFISETNKRVVPAQSTLIENTCPTVDTSSGPMSNFIFDGESYWMTGTTLQHSVYARVNYESVIYVYLYRPSY